ncbi:MAG: HAD-IIIC family phosphatase, partial [Planctomycetota bacterium]
LTLSALDMQFWGRLIYNKPVRAREGTFACVQTMAFHLRSRLIFSLPGARYLQLVPGFRLLVFLSYAPGVRLGRESLIFGQLYDPDITRIGDFAVIGEGAAISAHVLTTLPDGDRVYATEPVSIGDRAVVGGEARVGAGVVVGNDAIVEPMSNVLPFSQIGTGEVWGGDPACLKRMRSGWEGTDRSAELSARHNLATSTNDRSACRIVAAALRLPIESVGPHNCMDDYDEWDSLAQMSIATILANEFAVEVPASFVFRLHSVETIAELLCDKAAASVDEPAELPTDPELLPLLDTEVATRGLARLSANMPNPSRSVSVTVAATFVAHSLSENATLWLRAFGFNAAFELASFGQVQQLLFDKVDRFDEDYCVILLRHEDLYLQQANAILETIETVANAHPHRLIVSSLPEVASSIRSPQGMSSKEIANFNQRLQEIEGVALFPLGEILNQVGIRTAIDVHAEIVSRNPFSYTAWQAISAGLARVLLTRLRPPKKVLALDADGVLWGGVIGEDGMQGIIVGQDYPGRCYRLLQESALRLCEQGVLLVLVSRNESADVMQALEEHPELILRPHDFVGYRINWSQKSDNLRELAAELNVALDSIVFADDDPANQLEVKRALPEVTVLPLSGEPLDDCHMFDALWCFDKANVTNEDTTRAQMMRQESNRRQLRQQTRDVGDYLSSLELSVKVRFATSLDSARVSQLTNKTNQFNLNLRRHSPGEVEQLINQQRVLVATVRDRFSDYGQVGVVVFKRQRDATENVLQIDSFMLSCRALGRCVEHAMLTAVAQIACSEGNATFNACFVPGARNKPMLEFLKETCDHQCSATEFKWQTAAHLASPRCITFFGPCRESNNLSNPRKDANAGTMLDD